MRPLPSLDPARTRSSGAPGFRPEPEPRAGGSRRPGGMGNFKSMIRRWSPAGLAPPIGQYSHLAAVPADHELVFISGQVGVLEDGTLAGPDAESQTRQAFACIGRLLDSLGAGPEHLVKLLTLVSGTENLA